MTGNSHFRIKVKELNIMGVKVNGKIYTMNTQLSGDILNEHFGHKVVIAKYGEQNIALECDDCYTVLADSDIQE